MTDYKRMVSYMYQYENGVKRKNVGFVRVEAKGGQCKITLHMQLLGQLDSIFPTYLIQRGENNIELIYLGDTILKNQVMDSRLSADETNIMGTGYGLSEMGGVLLFLNDNVFFATEWDDKPIIATEVLEALRPKKSKSIVKNEPEKKEGIFRATSAKTAKEPFAQEEQINGKPLEEMSNERTSFEAKTSEGKSIEEIPYRVFEDELNMPRYKLPGGWKMVERLQKPNTAFASYPNHEAEEQINKVTYKMPNFINEGIKSIEMPVEEVHNKTIHNIGNQKTNHIFMNYSSNYNSQRPYLNINSEALQQEVAQTSQQEMSQNLQQDVLQTPQQEVPWEVQQTLQEEVSQEVPQSSQREAQETFSNTSGFNENNLEDIPTCSEEENNLPDHPTARRFFENYPRIYPFEDNEIILCVKIEPKDIGMLPKETWQYSNNSFLMHGFYCYHHLIFAKMKNRLGCRYIIGIPGIYHSREQFMARMFGFESFKSIRKRELKQGDFGYWYLPVNLSE